MSTKWVFVWEPNFGIIADNNQIFNAICQFMRSFAVQEDYRRSTFQYIESTQPIISGDQSHAAPDQPHIPAISLVQEPYKYYLLLHGNIIVETDKAWVISHKKLLGYRFEGFQYGWGDNTVKLHVGKVINDNNTVLKTVYMEVEYVDSCSIETTRSLMEEQIRYWQIVASIMSWQGQFVQIDGKYAEYGMSETYTPQHTVLQYYAVINRLKLGTKWIFVWEPNVPTLSDNYMFNEIFNDICHYAESIFTNIVIETTWKSTLTIVEPIMADQSQAAFYIYVVRLLEEPSKHYMIQSNPYKILEVDNWTIMSTKEWQFLFEGFQYQWGTGELQLRIGRVIDSRTELPVGAFMELDFLHNLSVERTRNRMEQHFNFWNQAAHDRSWPGRFVQIHRPYVEFGLSDIYTPQHTALQYYAVMAHLRAFYRRHQHMEN